MHFRRMIYYQQRKNGSKLIYILLANVLLNELYIYSNTRNLKYFVLRNIASEEFSFLEKFYCNCLFCQFNQFLSKTK